MKNKREVWVDNVKVFACILVVLGHFFQSMVKSSILPESNLYSWFNQTIYYFHVPLFFICSGYLYQKYSKVNSASTWISNIFKKALSLGIPYLTFAFVTWGLKTVFSSSVNDEVDGLIYILFIEPIPPYWYLYCLFFVFLVTPTFKNKRDAGIGAGIALLFKVLSIVGGCKVYAITAVLSNEIWFVMGMAFCVFDLKNTIKKVHLRMAISLGIFFYVNSILIYMLNISFKGLSFVMGIIACISIVVIFNHVYRENIQNQVFGYMAKYTMPIFLMHTIFAASVRSILLKIGIRNAVIHVLLGLLVSFTGPIVAAKLMSHFKWMDFILHPNKYINKKGEEKVL